MPVDHSGLRVAIVGSCQSLGLAAWTRMLLPGAGVHAWHVNVVPEATPDRIAAQIEAFEVVITQFSDDMGGGPLAVSPLRARFAKVAFLPMFVFNGFHADLTYCELDTEVFTWLRSPLDILQSEIVLAGLHLGLPQHQIIRLFNNVVFDALGYFSNFERSRAALLAVFAEHGHVLKAAFDEWRRDGCFMYSDNHPHIRVLGTLARQALAKTGLELADLETLGTPHDDLASGVQWHIPSGMARHLGLPNGVPFLRQQIAVADGQSREISLAELVRETAAAMARAAPVAPLFYPGTRAAAEKLAHLLRRQAFNMAGS